MTFSAIESSHSVLVDDAHLTHHGFQLLQLLTGVLLVGAAEMAAGQSQDTQGSLDDHGVGEGIELLEQREPLEVLPAACGSYPQCRWFKSDYRYQAPFV